MKKFALYVLAVFLTLRIIMLTSGCANVVPPTGGARDSLPPVLLKIVPADSTLNFTGKKITLTFDEYVELQDVQKNLTVSPNPGNNPLVEHRLRNVTIKLRDTLEANTTYAIGLGNAIKDVREGNNFQDFTYVFSTGNIIDNNTFSGKVILAETGKPDSTLIAVLHTSPEDSAVANMRPRYYTKMDSSGVFHFRFLAPGTYYLYAMQDNGIKRYMSKTQFFAFAEKPVTIPDTTTSALLYAYNTKEEPKKTTPVVNRSKPKNEEDRRLKYQTNLQGEQLDILGDFTMTFNDPLKTFDTSKIVLTDEKFTPLENYTITPDSTSRVYTLKYAWKPATAYQLILDKEFASDSLDRQLLKTDTIPVKTKSEADYGSVQLKFTGLDLAKKPVLQLIRESTIVLAQPLNSNQFYTKLFTPGDYEIRILYDTNENGIWDPGNFFEGRLQPEIVLSITEKLSVKPGWDDEVTIEIGK